MIILGIIICAITGFIILIYDNKENYAFYRFISLVLFMVGMVMWIEPDSYKRGQVDALNKVIKYRLEKNSDSTTTWKEITK